MKLIKIAFSLITIVILLIVVAAITLPQLVNPNDYKRQITDAITQHTGLNASIEGDLSLSVFPWLGVSTGQVVLEQPKVIQASIPDAGNFVDVSAIDIRVKLLPLLSKKVEVDTVLLKQPLIEFVVNKTGKNSLSGLQTATATAETPETTPTDTSSPTADTPAAIAAFSIAGVDISNGQLIFDDKQAGVRYELSDLTIQSGNILEASAPFSISAKAAGTNIEPIILTLQSDLSLNKDTMAATLSSLNLSVQQSQNTADLTLASLDYQHAKSALTVSDLNLSAEAEGYPIELSVPSITANLSTAIASIETFSVNSHNLALTGNIDLKNWNTAPMAIGRISSNTFDAQSLLKKLAIDYTPTNASALSALSIETQFNATANGAALQNITANIDNTILTGDAAIVNFANPRYSFDLALSSLIVDDYLPVSDKNASNDDAAAPTAAEALAAPIVLLKDIYANGVFRADKIVASKLTLTDNIIQVTSTDKRVTITPTVNLYKGQLAGTTILERGNTPTLLVKNTLTNVDLGPLLTDADVTDQFSGIATINTDIKVTQTAEKPSSKGTVKVLVKDGTIEGVDIKKVLDDAQNTIDKIRGKDIQNNADTSEDSTRFAEMTATLLIDNDIITNNDLSMKAPVFRVNGEGSVNTAEQTLDYLTSIIVVNTNEGQGGEDLANLKGFTIPVRFSGALASPKYAIDTKALLKANTAKTLAKEKDKLKDKLSEKLKLNNTDGNDAQSPEDALKDKLKKKLFDKLF
ncbi:AsmA family protein [Eionea flava]